MFCAKRSLLRGAAGVFAACLLCAGARGSDLEKLAGFDAASGDESRIVRYIAARVGGAHEIDNTGSLTASFGSGAPHLLLVAGVDEPGYVVSAIDGEGYLRLEAPAEPLPRYDPDKFFTGRHVHVTNGAGKTLNGAVAAPSVHFAAGRSLSSSSSRGLFVDIGAAGPQEAAAAGVAVLDRVTLAKRPAWLSDDVLGAPWLSSRSGSAVLLALAERLRRERPAGKVTLAFVTRQHYYNAGLRRVLQRTQPERVLLLAPHGENVSGVAGVSGFSSALADELLALAADAGYRIEKRPAANPSFGPFGDEEAWTAGAQAAALFPAVRNGGSPAASVSAAELARLTSLLEAWIGLQPRQPEAVAQRLRADGSQPAPDPQGARSDFERTVISLVETAGVSGAEGSVRELLRKAASEAGAAEAQSDDKGNLIVRLGKGGPPDAIFIAHMDEIGFAVRRIASSGTIFTATKGGGDAGLFAWHPVTVYTAAGALPAQMTRHGSIEVGASSADEVAARGIAEGDSVTVPKTYRRLLGSRVSARSLDDRLGCAVLLEALRRIARRSRGASGAVWFAFSVEEEVGLLGAKHLAAEAAPARVYPIDTFVTSDSPLEDRRIAYARLGAGPVLRALDHSGLTPRDEVRRVAALARRNAVPLQIGVTAGGNDGSKFTAFGAVNIPIGFPLRYAHTPAETADLRDAEAAVELIVALAREELRN